MCVDDYSADSSTSGILQTGQLISARFDWCDVGDDYWTDVDWFRLDVEAGASYQISGTAPGGDMELSWIGDGIRELHLSQFLDGEAKIIYTAEANTHVFVSASNVIGESSGTYYLRTKRYEIPEDSSTVFNLKLDVPRSHAIETEFDRDFFRVQLMKGWVYQFGLNGNDSSSGTLADPYLRVYDENVSLLSRNDNGPSDRDSLLTFTAPYEGGFFLSAAGFENHTGTYSIGYSLTSYVDDAATGRATPSVISTTSNQFGTVARNLETSFDIDWHRADLVAGRWYQFLADSYAVWLAVRDSDLTVRGSSHRGYFYFQARQTGAHYIVVRNKSEDLPPREYRVSVWDNAAPKIDETTTIMRLEQGGSVGLMELVSINHFPASHIQFYSELSFFRGGVQQAPFQLVTVPIAEISQYRFQVEPDKQELGDVSIRAIAADNTVSGWVQTTLDMSPDFTHFLETNNVWSAQNTQRQSDQVITYHFSDSIPSYFQPGRFSGFSPVAEGIQDIFNGFFDNQFRDSTPDIANTTNLKFERIDSEDADIQIFAANMLTDAVGYRPGRYGGGDIVLDRLTFEGQIPLPGSEKYLQLVRAVGTAMGLKHWAPEFKRTESVMGRTDSSDTSAQPSTFGYWDVERLRSLYGTARTGVRHFGTRIYLGRDSGSFFKTIARTTSGDRIVALSSPQGVVVDLRPGAESYLMDRTQRYIIGRNESVDRAIGSDFDDQLTGNFRPNRIEANDGADTLRGLAGNDELLGGSGDDHYLYETGDGNDVIIEAGNNRDDGGIDTLQIRGKFGMTGIQDDLTFRRHGDDLLIDLDMNSQFNRQNGTLRIQEMAKTGSQVERLDLRNFSKKLEVISLVSIWDSISHDKQRFHLTSESDAYGLVAAPV